MDDYVTNCVTSRVDSIMLVEEGFEVGKKLKSLRPWACLKM